MTENKAQNAMGIRIGVVRSGVGELTLSWQNISREQAVLIANSIAGNNALSVTFLNPLSGVVETKSFYVGDRAIEISKYVSALEYWGTLSIPFTEA